MSESNACLSESNACLSLSKEFILDGSAVCDQPIGPLDNCADGDDSNSDECPESDSPQDSPRDSPQDSPQVCPHDYLNCPVIRDIYRRASVAKVLTPFLEELDTESEKHGDKIDFTVARKLDEQFFGIRYSGHWRKAFQDPEIGHVLQSSEFTYPVPDCGFVVKDHGLLTMTIALNIPSVLRAYEERRALEQEHAEFHEALGDPECTDNDVCDEFVAQLQELDSEINVSYVYHSDENENDDGNDFDADEDDESE